MNTAVIRKTLSLYFVAIMLCTGCGYTFQEERIAHETASDPDYREKYLNTPARFYAEQVMASRLEIFAVKEYTLSRYGGSVRRVADRPLRQKRRGLPADSSRTIALRHAQHLRFH